MEKKKKILLSARLRPFNEKEILSNEVSDWECINKNTIVYNNVCPLASDRPTYPTAYVFDRVFGSDCSTREVYEQGAKEVAISVVHGINSTVLAYGQTSSGKTHTMTGFTEYAIADIYEYILNHQERDFIVKFSAMVIHDESVKDLLSADNSPLRLLDDPERGTVVVNLTEERLRNRDHAIQLLSLCKAERGSGKTTLNEMRSKSHKIFRLTIESFSHGFQGRSTLAATVNFVDLAGSEQASETSPADLRLKEGYRIDHSLQTLKTVIYKLSHEGSEDIPYGDSVLTRILQASLEGNARTAIICTMNPGRTHVKQSRNTLNFASCAKVVSTNAKTNVIDISDKALVKHLQNKIERLESELRSNQSNSVPSIYAAMLREKDAQIEKLEREVKDLILQRDIAQEQAKELLRNLRDDTHTSPLTAVIFMKLNLDLIFFYLFILSLAILQVGLGQYPQLRVRKSSDMEILESQPYVLADTQSFNDDCITEYRGRNYGDCFAKVLCFSETSIVSEGVSTGSSTSSSVRDLFQSWDRVEKENNGTVEDLCKEVHCIETENTSNMECNYLFPEDYHGIPAAKVHVNEDGHDLELASTYSSKDDIFVLSPLKDEHESVKKHTESGITPHNNSQEVISAPVMKDRESNLQMMKNKEAFSVKSLVVTSHENPSLTHHDVIDKFGPGSSNFSRSKSSQDTFITNSPSPRLTIKQYSDCATSVGSEKEPFSYGGKIYAPECGFNVDMEWKENFPHLLENGLDIDADKLVVKVPTTEAGVLKRRPPNMSKKAGPSTEQKIAEKSDSEIASNINESPKVVVKDVGLSPVKDECRVVTSWPVEFRKLQREIIQLWDACNVPLVHRTYFFLLFQGDPSDAIYLEVEIRRLKFLKDKFSRGEKTTVNGRRISPSSSKKALHQEREMLSKQMLKRFSEQERESLFRQWGIGLNTKWRRLQLAELVWTKTNDINHIVDSASLVAKLVDIIDPGQALNKDMFGLDFTPTSASGISTFKRSLISIL